MDIQVLTIDDCGKEMLHDFDNGLDKGTTTHFPLFDNAWTWRPGELNVWSGYSNEGKSLFLKQLCLAKYLMEGKKFLFASPEDAPAKSFFDDFIHTLSGKTTDKTRPECISRDEYRQCMVRIREAFKFVQIKAPDNTIPNVLNTVRAIQEKEDIYGVIIDPIMKFSRPGGAPERDDLYASYTTSVMTDFSREQNLSLHLVIHQLTPKKDSSGLYEKPSMYQIKSGGSWADGSDNVLFVQRPNYAKDKMDTSVHVGSLKIKKQKLVGVPQDFAIAFDRKTNRYVDMNGRPVFEVPELLANHPKSLLYPPIIRI